MNTQSSEVPADVSRSIVGYAILRANFDNNEPSYIQNFSSFVLDVLAQAYPKSLTEGEIADRVRQNFGLTIPDRVVGHLLKKALQRNLVTSVQNRFNIVDSSPVGVPDLHSAMTKFVRQQQEVLRKFADFVEKKSPQHADEFTTVVLANSLQRYVEQNAVPLLSKALRPAFSDSRSSIGGGDAAAYLVSAFLDDLYTSDTAAFEYVVDSVKGAMLASVLELDTGNMSQRLDKIHLALDTPVVLKALGYQGEEQCRAAKQMLDLALKLKANIVCFRHTVREVDGVLESAQYALASRVRRQGSRREVDAYFIENGKTPSDIEMLRASLEQDLRTLQVRIVEAPDNYYQHGLDESQLADQLQLAVGYKSHITRDFDVQSLSAIHRSRKGSKPVDFLHCGWVLITGNDALARASGKVETKHNWPLAMLDSEVATILWVRSPAVAEDLPRQQLLATAYAGLQPNSRLWAKYLDEVETLQLAGNVSEDQALILRARPEARRALMDVTLGEEDELTSQTVLDVMDSLRSDIAAPFVASVASAIADRDTAVDKAEFEARKREQLASKVQEMQSSQLALASELIEAKAHLERALVRDSERDQKIAANARLAACRYIRGGVIGLGALLVVASVCDFAKPAWMAKLPGWLSVILFVLGAAGVALGMLRGVMGGSLREWARPLENRLAKLIETRRRHKLGLE